MPTLQTKAGPIEVRDLAPGRIHPRVKFWTEALQDVLRVEEQWALVDAMLLEAYNAGAREKLIQFLLGGQGEIIDAVVGSSDSETAELVDADGSVERPTEDGGLPGGGEEVPGGQPVDTEKVEEDPETQRLGEEVV